LRVLQKAFVLGEDLLLVLNLEGRHRVEYIAIPRIAGNGVARNPDYGFCFVSSRAAILQTRKSRSAGFARYEPGARIAQRLTRSLLWWPI